MTEGRGRDGGQRSVVHLRPPLEPCAPPACTRTTHGPRCAVTEWGDRLVPPASVQLEPQVFADLADDLERPARPVTLGQYQARERGEPEPAEDAEVRLLVTRDGVAWKLGADDQLTGSVTAGELSGLITEHITDLPDQGPSQFRLYEGAQYAGPTITVRYIDWTEWEDRGGLSVCQEGYHCGWGYGRRGRQ